MPKREWLAGAICFIDRSEITSDMIAGVEGCWEGLKRGRLFPSRQDVDPFVFRAWLPYISIVELQDDPFRVFYRLVGTEVARFGQEDFSYKWLNDTNWDPALKAANLEIYQRLRERRAPLFGLSRIEWEGRNDQVFEWGVFPLSNDGQTISHCLSVDDFRPIAPRLSPLG
jgi:hypothetical protein